MPASFRPAVREEPGPHAWLELRDAASAARLAVQMLNGPLAPWTDPAPDPVRMREIIGALEQATRKVCSLVTTLQPSANERPPVAIVPEPAPPVQVAGFALLAADDDEPDDELDAEPEADAEPAPVAKSRTRARLLERASPTASTDLDALLHQLEITVVTRSHPPALLSVHAATGLRTSCEHASLLHVLTRLVEDAAVLGPAPETTVSLRAYLDPAEELGDAMDVVFELRPDPRAPAAALSWTRTSLDSAPAGASLSSKLVAGQWCARLRVPALVRDPSV